MKQPEQRTTRRQFNTCAGSTVAGAALAGVLASPRGVHAVSSDTIKIALVGCGGRGTGAAFNALSTIGPTKLWAMADVFEHRLSSSRKRLEGGHAEQFEAPPDRCFLGMDAYRKAVDAVAPGGVVLLTTPPAFRPIHLEYAVSRGCHVFMEKSFAVDAPGIRRVLKAGKEAEKKNLKIAGGLMSRHDPGLEEVVGRIHDGAIGDIVTCWAYREHHPVGFKPRRDGMNELAQQIQNYSNFTWLNGSFLLDWLIHNLDVCCWAKQGWPVSAQGQGGREVRDKPDQLFDHYSVEYTFADGTRMQAQGRHMIGCWGFFGDVLHGTKGSAILGEGINIPRLFTGYKQTKEHLQWQYKGGGTNKYQVEHDRLFNAIRQDLPYNESERCAYAAMTGILGRMAAESGKNITWDDALASNLELAPGLEQMTMESDAPVAPDADGNYPIARPGFTKVL